MNKINKKSIDSLGYDFIPKQFLPKGKNEYYLRDIQYRPQHEFRQLTPAERDLLERNGNSSDNWNNFYVSGIFDVNLIRNCKFYGMIRVGNLEPYFAEFNNLRMPVGLYNSTIISCDFGNNIVIDNVNFMSHYIIGHEVILVNINELAGTDHSKFGNGVLKVGEDESVRIWLEICNENGGRSVLPFNGMLAGDAWLWSKYRADEKLLDRFKEFTDQLYDTQRGYYGKIGDRTVIKNSGILKDVWIGSDAYIKGANKLKNLTINSSPEAPSQVGEGCEIVNGIVGYGCRIFYGVKAVRFILGSNSQLKYGARLINSYLGDNSTISCCEVLNSLIFSAHEQHHNNSFLCAAVVMGQSNMAAGATIGSNHNSRGADGELVAGRGFWPGLCVSLKHNSKFASFNLIAKGDYPAELNIPFPFCLVSNDSSKDELKVMPAYWLLYNMYALARNSSKYRARDQRYDKTQEIEYDYLAPDSVNELFTSLALMKEIALVTLQSKNNKIKLPGKVKSAGKQQAAEYILTQYPKRSSLKFLASGFENSHRAVEVLKMPEAYSIFQELIVYYGALQLIQWLRHHPAESWISFYQSLPAKPRRENWKNIGGQLMKDGDVDKLVKSIKNGKVGGWNEVHDFYNRKSASYGDDKFEHAYASLLEILEINHGKFSRSLFFKIMDQALTTREWMVRGIYESRAKDYDSPYRKMLYETQQEMEKVIGKLSDNSFIRQQKEELKSFKSEINRLRKQLI